ncbi:DUF7507 domain-containing protein, partial [Winogradskyella immobilis]|nr:gliding motility-associated C-terminal domain-containing protein [Winogradskyella immobilis]MCG0017782.1 gliding motility-associated C-terminal domain-containing protein [Winogradskyella immobilis]
NQATAEGDDPNGDPVSDDSDDPTDSTDVDPDGDGDPDDPTVTSLGQDPSISLLKTAVFNDEDGDGFGDVGETITYSFTVSNTGNVPVTNISITDPLVTVTGGPIDLAVGASDSGSFTAIYTLDQDDIDAGFVMNQATAEGDDPNGDPVSD